MQQKAIKVVLALALLLLLLLLGGIMTLIYWGANHMFKSSTLMGWLYIVGIVISTTILTLSGIWWYKTELPKIWRRLAEKNKFITLLIEKHWSPVEKGERFLWSFSCLDGKIKLQVPNPEWEEGDPHLIDATPEQIFSGLDLFLFRYFLGQGCVWLGLDASEEGTTSVGVLKIRKTKIKGQGSSLELVDQGEVEIRALRLVFNRYFDVSESETTDGYEVEMFCLGIVTVVDPYLAWYGLGGRAYETMDTKIQSVVRSAVERYSLISFYAEEENAEDEVETRIADGDPEMVKTLGMSIQLTIEGWSDNSTPEFREMIGKVQTILRKTEIELAELEKLRVLTMKRQEIIDAEKQVEITRLQLEIQKALSNEQEYKAILSAAGGNADLATQLVLRRQLGPSYDEYLRANALKETRVQVLGEGVIPMLKLHD